ncbi:MAG: glucose-1-phosphate cytidylyltransferase [Verrucomicrobiota bacterium]|nr:glucose-1-phosphate cytidylyltransferase [Verrucomicrobiota bacterium]
MKVVILAGGLGTRLSEETEIKPKPMVEIGGRPILWHIMKHYAHYGFQEFYIALGYRGEVIKRFFMDYYSLDGSISLNLASGELERQERECEDWIIHLKNTGQESNTGGRLKRLEGCLNEGTFMMTYGDGVCDVNLEDLLEFHRALGRLATVTAVRPPSRFGGLVFDDDSMVAEFTEKPQIGEGWINGGFLVFEPGVFKYLEGDHSILEVNALERLAADRQLAAYRHEGFWQCMDTLRDKRLLESLWHERRAPWKVWP